MTSKKLLDWVGYNIEPKPKSLEEEMSLAEHAKKMIDGLTDKEREILAKRFGLDGARARLVNIETHFFKEWRYRLLALSPEDRERRIQDKMLPEYQWHRTVQPETSTEFKKTDDEVIAHARALLAGPTSTP